MWGLLRISVAMRFILSFFVPPFRMMLSHLLFCAELTLLYYYSAIWYSFSVEVERMSINSVGPSLSLFVPLLLVFIIVYNLNQYQSAIKGLRYHICGQTFAYIYPFYFISFLITLFFSYRSFWKASEAPICNTISSILALLLVSMV